MNWHVALLVRKARRVVLSLGLALFASGLLTSFALGQDQAPKVYVMPTSGTVDQIMAQYIHDGLAKAADQGAAAVLIELNTPGGDLTATRDIVTSLLNTPLPVIIWVGPAGVRAASAGTYITLAANVAVMAEGTNIGAATPVDSSGQNIGTDLQAKIFQDTEAMLRNIASVRNRNYDWALTTVTDSKAYTADEALAAGGIDAIANSPQEAVAAANGRTVTVNGQPVTLNLAGASLQDLEMNPLQSFLHLLSDPNIAFVLFTVGFYGLIFELAHPNLLTGVLGGVSIVLAFIGFGSLPLNLAGLLLIGIGLILFVVDLHVLNHGLPTIAGLVCFVLGAAALYTEPGVPGAPDFSVALPVLGTMTVITALFMGLIVYTASRIRRSRTAPGLIGAGLQPDALGEVRRPLTPIGSVYAGGEEWTAKTADERPLPRGAPVKIIRQEGLTLIVEPTD
jgi:membrane-bound serine protease (ClpP class)